MKLPFIRITLRKGYKTLSDFYRDLTHSKVDVQEFLNLYEQELAAVSLIEAQPSIGSARSAEDFTYQESESESNQINTSEVLILDRGSQELLIASPSAAVPSMETRSSGL